MVSRRLAKRSLAIAKANAQAGADAALTIAARTQNLLAPGGRQSDKAREARLMVQEKVDAAIEGAFAAQAAWGAFFIKAAFGGVRTPNDVSAGLTAIAEAAAAPARRKVRANARRLTGAKGVALDMELVPHLQHFVATYGYLAVFLIVAMESAGIPMPGETVLVTAAIFAASGTLNIYGVIGAAAAGAIIGDNCGYWIGRELGFPLDLPIRALHSP